MSRLSELSVSDENPASNTQTHPPPEAVFVDDDVLIIDENYAWASVDPEATPLPDLRGQLRRNAESSADLRDLLNDRHRVASGRVTKKKKGKKSKRRQCYNCRRYDGHHGYDCRRPKVIKSQVSTDNVINNNNNHT